MSVSGDEPRPLKIPSPYKSCAVLTHKRVTAEDHFQDVRLLTVACDDAFEPGDVAVILPRNISVNVEEFFKLLPHIDPDRPLKLGAGERASQLFFAYYYIISWGLKRKITMKR